MSPTPWGPDLVEAYVRVGRHDDAPHARCPARGRRGPAAGPLDSAAALSRCAGLVEADSDPQFRAALSAQARLPIPFEVARTRVCHGERLRIADRLDDAAVELGHAYDVFAALGATGWARRAERELASCGSAPEPARPPALAALTAKEYQVAAMIANGATNRDAAANLLLSTRTVEAHLARVYRKLGINSRSQLVKEFSQSRAREATHGEPPA